MLLGTGIFVVTHQWHAQAATKHELPPSGIGAPEHTHTRLPPGYGERVSNRPTPGPAVEPYVKPEFARQMRTLRPKIIAAARRHNRPAISGMSDHEFAVVMTLLLYNENFGWPEDQLTPLQRLTPLYEGLQIYANEVGGTNLTVQPAKLRPSVALEILRSEVPVPAPTMLITESITVAGSHVKINAYASQSALYAAITAEITEPDLAVEYMAANLERGLYRAQFEGVPVTWQTLAAWYNRGIVTPEDIRASPQARYYIRRASAYFEQARALIDTPAPRPAHPKYVVAK
jgi:hypothetical protein